MFLISLFVIPVDVNKTCILDIDNQSASLIIDKDINSFIRKENITSCNVTIERSTYTTK
jgi:hypothetical protein